MSDLRAVIALIFVAMLGIGLAAAPASSQESPGEKKEAKEPEDTKDFFLTPTGLNIQAALWCLASGDAIASASARVVIDEWARRYPLLPDWKFEFTEVIPLNGRYLELIEDNRSLPDMRAKLLVELKRPDRGFYAAYIEAMWRSHQATQEMFDKSAEEFKHTVYSDLASDGPRYRGKIITVHGTLTRLRERDAPKIVENEGIFKFYMGEVRGPTKGAPVFVAVFTELPLAFKDLKFGTKETEEMSRSVTFQGYFLANIRFPADKGTRRPDLSHPYLVGKTIIVHDKADAVAANGKPPGEVVSTSYVLIVVTLGGIVAVVFLGVLLNLWFRRGDRKIESQLAEMREKHQPFSLEPDDASAEASPAEPTKPGKEAENQSGHGPNTDETRIRETP